MERQLNLTQRLASVWSFRSWSLPLVSWRCSSSSGVECWSRLRQGSQGSNEALSILFSTFVPSANAQKAVKSVKSSLLQCAEGLLYHPILPAHRWSFGSSRSGRLAKATEQDPWWNQNRSSDQGARFVPLPVFLSLPAVFCLILRGCFG